MIGLAKYLVEFGWEPVILSAPLKTKSEAEFRVIEAQTRNKVATVKKKLGFNPDKGLQEQIGVPSTVRGSRSFMLAKILKLIEGVLTYPDVDADWKPFALAAADELLKKERLDAIISVWPITAHLIAEEIKSKYKIPWIADFPDLWSETYAYGYGPMRQFFDRRLEKKTLRNTNYITTSSAPLVDSLKRLHKEKNISVIKIGFDPNIVNDPAVSVTNKFTITYTGVFYGKERNPFKFFEALSELASKKLIDPADFNVRFYGAKQDFIQAGIEKYGLTDFVKQYGPIPWEECLERQRESQLLLQLNWENKKEKGAYSGKITEYLAARRPVLSVGGWGGDVIEELFSKTGVGTYCLCAKDAAKAILACYKDYKKNGVVAFKGNIEVINEYSNREMAKKFSQLLNNLA